MKNPNSWVRLEAINVLDRLDTAAREALPALKAALTDKEPYVVRVAKHAVEAFGIHEDSQTPARKPAGKAKAKAKAKAVKL